MKGKKSHRLRNSILIGMSAALIWGCESYEKLPEVYDLIHYKKNTEVLPDCKVMVENPDHWLLERIVDNLENVPDEIQERINSEKCGVIIYDRSIEQFNKELQRNNTSISDKTKIQSYFENHNAVSLVENTSIEKLKSVRWFIDCGDDDFLYEGNSLVHIAMRKKKIPHEFRIRDGGHTWTYWRESLPEVLSFISDAFHQY